MGRPAELLQPQAPETQQPINPWSKDAEAALKRARKNADQHSIPFVQSGSVLHGLATGEHDNPATQLLDKLGVTPAVIDEELAKIFPNKRDCKLSRPLSPVINEVARRRVSGRDMEKEPFTSADLLDIILGDEGVDQDNPKSPFTEAKQIFARAGVDMKEARAELIAIKEK